MSDFLVLDNPAGDEIKEVEFPEEPPGPLATDVELLLDVVYRFGGAYCVLDIVQCRLSWEVDPVGQWRL